MRSDKKQERGKKRGTKQTAQCEFRNALVSSHALGSSCFWLSTPARFRAPSSTGAPYGYVTAPREPGTRDAVAAAYYDARPVQGYRRGHLERRRPHTARDATGSLSSKRPTPIRGRRIG